jgi:3-dehydroquinate synthase
MESVSVALGERAYSIHIGPGILDATELYAPHVAGRATAIVTNEVVGAIYLSRLKSVLQRAGARVAEVVLEDGEQAKRWQNLDRICDTLLAARFDRESVIVALGGGVVGDLGGFAAAVYQRGIAFLQVPTTLLAQVDSAVGGKTAINHARGKNMIGAFHQPLAVISDVTSLDTLPDRELRAGLAEVIKYGAALDARFFEWLEENIGMLLSRQRDALIYAVRRCCELKASVVEEDERESGRRALLNFGHTFGHSIEGAAGYGKWLHGEAVAAGMVMASELSRRLGLISAQEVSRLSNLLERAGLPITGPDLPTARLMELIAVDKKSAQGQVRYVVLQAVGRAALQTGIEDEMVRQAILAATHQDGTARKPL